MRRSIWILLALLSFLLEVKGQDLFNYKIQLEPIQIPGLPGLHSFAYAQHDEHWLIIGGRTDGLHARQPFRSFPEAENNTVMYVVNPDTKQVWQAAVSQLPVRLAEHMQSGNMNFHQWADTLYIIGGYAYAASIGDHITFPYLTTIDVPGLITAIKEKKPLISHFQQLEDSAFAVTGGHLGKIGNHFLLVGGQRFDGRYNPMDHPTFVQQYTDQIRSFRIHTHQGRLTISDYSVHTDPVHLHRRDYNLIPRIYPDGSHGYTISSGVFQPLIDLPYLYPVNISATGYTPQPSFNQYLNNYHTAFASIYESGSGIQHTLFFGGLSQYYIKDGQLIRDDEVPFVQTISRISIDANGQFSEFNMPVEMPAFLGTSAEFITNPQLPAVSDRLIDVQVIKNDSFIIGHIVGGIASPSPNPFNSNETDITSASSVIYVVKMIRNSAMRSDRVDGSNPFSVEIIPNPARQKLFIRASLKYAAPAEYIITDLTGKIVAQGNRGLLSPGVNELSIDLPYLPGSSVLMVNVIFENKFFTVSKVHIQQ